MTTEVAFFHTLSLPKMNKSYLEIAQEKIDSLFYFGGKIITPIEGLSKNGVQCLQRSPGETPNYVILALKISVCLTATVFAAVVIAGYLNNESRSTTTYYLNGVVTRIVRSPPPSALIENYYQFLWNGNSFYIRAMRISSYVTYTMLALKFAIRSVFLPNFHVVDSKYDLTSAKETLEEEITLTPEMISKVKDVWQRRDEQLSGVHWFNHQVFQLKEFPDLVFKHSDNEQRFINMVVSQAVCLGELFTQLVHPHAKHFSLEEDGVIIAEQCVPINPIEENQEHYYQKYGDRLEKAFMEAKKYVLETKESDYEWRNFPLYGLNPSKEDGLLKLALIDHDMRESSQWGLLGHDDLNRRGLIRCLPEEQARKVANSLSKDFPRTQEVLEERLEQIRRDQRLEAFYASKKIAGKDALPHTYALNDQQGKIIDDINETLTSRDASQYLALKGLRKIRLTYKFNLTGSSPFDMYNNDVWNGVQAAYESLKSRGVIFDFSYQLKKQPTDLAFPGSFPKVTEATITIQA